MVVLPRVGRELIALAAERQRLFLLPLREKVDRRVAARRLRGVPAE
jgi:hypothetical protein